MKSKAERQLDQVRRNLKAYFELLDSDENVGIYGFAHNHGLHLSEAFIKKSWPLAQKLKKFAGVK